jgi:hypothetical protein
MDSFGAAAQLGAYVQQAANNMDFFLFVAAGVSVFSVCVCINAAAQELRGIRSVLQAHADLEPVKVRTYQRKRPDGNV